MRSPGVTSNNVGTGFHLTPNLRTLCSVVKGSCTYFELKEGSGVTRCRATELEHPLC
jgi:hypothetical protein